MSQLCRILNMGYRAVACIVCDTASLNSEIIFKKVENGSGHPYLITLDLLYSRINREARAIKYSGTVLLCFLFEDVIDCGSGFLALKQHKRTVPLCLVWSFLCKLL